MNKIVLICLILPITSLLISCTLPDGLNVRTSFMGLKYLDNKILIKPVPRDIHGNAIIDNKEN